MHTMLVNTHSAGTHSVGTLSTPSMPSRRKSADGVPDCSGGLPGVEYRKREWWDGTKWTQVRHLPLPCGSADTVANNKTVPFLGDSQGFPPNILDKMFMESPVRTVVHTGAYGGAQLHHCPC